MAVFPFECTFRFLAPFQTSFLPLRSAHGQFSKGIPDNQAASILQLLFHPKVSLFRQFCCSTFAPSTISPPPSTLAPPQPSLTYFR